MEQTPYRDALARLTGRLDAMDDGDRYDDETMAEVVEQVNRELELEDLDHLQI